MKKSSHTLDDLIEKGRRYAPNYLPSANSDHLPMALCAMFQLGASDEALIAFQQSYTPKLHLNAPASFSWPAQETNFEAMIGKPDAYVEISAFLDAEIASKGIQEVLRRYVKDLIPSMAVDAFHPMIRLSFAIEFGYESEVANALAYWFCNHQQTPTSVDTIDLHESFNKQSKHPNTALTSLRFGDALEHLIAHEQYPVGRADDMQTCAAVSLDVYRATRNFFALHMVTATNAAQSLQPFCDEELLVAATSGALLAAHQIVGSPTFDFVTPHTKSGDSEHVVKYGFACLQEYERYGDARYLDEFDQLKSVGSLPDWARRSD